MDRLTAELERRGENVQDVLSAAMDRLAEQRGREEDERRRPADTGPEHEVAPGVSFDPDLLGHEVDAPTQEGLFTSREGTAAARNLRQSEAAARAELEKLRVVAKQSTDASTRQRALLRIGHLERLVNREKAISAQELATRAA